MIRRTICYDAGDPLPRNGWFITCKALNRQAFAGNLEELAALVGMLEDEVYRTDPEAILPVQVFELGREVELKVIPKENPSS